MGDVTKLRLLHDNIESHFRNLKSLGVVTVILESMLVTILMEKIPDELRLIITRRFATDSWEIKKVLHNFYEELSAREKCYFKATKMDKPETFLSTAASLHTSGKIICCVFCDQKYPSSKCTVFTDIKNMKSILVIKGKCFLCLRG